MGGKRSKRILINFGRWGDQGYQTEDGWPDRLVRRSPCRTPPPAFPGWCPLSYSPSLPDASSTRPEVTGSGARTSPTTAWTPQTVTPTSTAATASVAISHRTPSGVPRTGTAAPSRPASTACAASPATGTPTAVAAVRAAATTTVIPSLQPAQTVDPTGPGPMVAHGRRRRRPLLRMVAPARRRLLLLRLRPLRPLLRMGARAAARTVTVAMATTASTRSATAGAARTRSAQRTRRASRACAGRARPTSASTTRSAPPSTTA